MLRSKNYTSSSETTQKYYMHKNSKINDFYLVKDLDFSFGQEQTKVKFSGSQHLFYPLINKTNKFSNKVR